MRNTTYSIQTSVYVVYLEEIGLVGTTIGLLFATGYAWGRPAAVQDRQIA